MSFVHLKDHGAKVVPVMTEPQRRRDASGRRTRLATAGFAYVALLAAIAIIGIGLGAAGKYWQNISKRDKEEELLFRGEQYRIAIARYYYAIPGRLQFPPSVDDLLTDNRTATGKRHLRKRYKDPFTNEDFVLIHDQLSKRIIGVRSPSDKEPLKKAEFPEVFKDFAGKGKYSEWQFIFIPTPPQAPAPPRR